MIAYSSTNTADPRYSPTETSNHVYSDTFFIIPSDLYIAADTYRDIKKIGKAVSKARAAHIKQMKQDQENWWFEGLRKQVNLYRGYYIKPITFRKVLRCNRKGIGLRIKRK